MGGLFSRHHHDHGAENKGQPDRITEQDKAVLKLKTQRDRLQQYQKKINLVLEKEREAAKKLLREGQRDKARALLKKKRYQEKLLRDTEAQLDNLESLTQSIEFKQLEQKVVEGLKEGNTALGQLQKELSIEEVEAVMDEEINELLAGKLTEEDDEAIAAEFDALFAAEVGEGEAEGEAEAEAEGDTTPAMPDVPNTDLPEAEEATPAATKAAKFEPTMVPA